MCILKVNYKIYLKYFQCKKKYPTNVNFRIAERSLPPSSLSKGTTTYTASRRLSTASIAQKNLLFLST